MAVANELGGDNAIENRMSHGGSETTLYVGGLLEKLTTATRTHWKHRLALPSGEVQEVIRRSDGSTETLYVTSDHLGSTEAVLDGAGALRLRGSFGVHGARRSSNWTGAPSGAEWQAIADTTRRGYTGHEMLDNVLLVHMNGRVYEPRTGRFLSADPHVDGAAATQGWNRYAYVHGRVLSARDPSGFAATSSGTVTVEATRLTPFDRDYVLPRLSELLRLRPPTTGLPLDGEGLERIEVRARRQAEAEDRQEPIAPVVVTVQGQQSELPCSGFWGAAQDATGGESNQAWYDDVADNFVYTTDTGASGVLSTGLSVAGASTTAKSWGGITLIQLGQQAWNSRYGAIQTPGLIGAGSISSAFVTAGASWVVNAVLINGAYNSGVIAGSLIRTGVNRAANGLCSR